MLQNYRANEMIMHEMMLKCVSPIQSTSRVICHLIVFLFRIIFHSASDRHFLRPSLKFNSILFGAKFKTFDWEVWAISLPCNMCSCLRGENVSAILICVHPQLYTQIVPGHPHVWVERKSCIKHICAMEQRENRSNVRGNNCKYKRVYIVYFCFPNPLRTF